MDYNFKPSATTPAKACEIGKNSVIKKMREEGLLDENCKGVDNAIAELKAKLGQLTDVSPELNKLIRESFELGVKSGFSRSLKRFQDGSITTRKVNNEDQWVLYSNSNRFQITQSLPSMNDEKVKSTVYVTLAEHGFE